MWHLGKKLSHQVLSIIYIEHPLDSFLSDSIYNHTITSLHSIHSSFYSVESNEQYLFEKLAEKITIVSNKMNYRGRNKISFLWNANKNHFQKQCFD